MLIDFIPPNDKIIEWNENLDRCIRESGDEDGIFESWKLPLDQQENPFKLEGCPEVGFCEVGFNFNHKIEMLSHLRIVTYFHSFSPSTMEEMRTWKNPYNIRNNYGVCDNYKQILKRYPELKKDKQRKFLVGMTPIIRKHQPERNGWRWCKWGSYIGKHKPTSEYIYDDENIDMVYVFHIYEVEDNSK